jgi:hypothetical protein
MMERTRDDEIVALLERIADTLGRIETTSAEIS